LDLRVPDVTPRQKALNAKARTARRRAVAAGSGATEVSGESTVVVSDRPGSPDSTADLKADE